MTIKWVKWVGNAYSLWCQHFLGKKKKWPSHIQDRTKHKRKMKSESKWIEIEGVKKKNKASFSITVTYRMAELPCFQSKCFLLGDIYIYIFKLIGKWLTIYAWMGTQACRRQCPREIRLRLEFSGVLGNRVLRKIRILL